MDNITVRTRIAPSPTGQDLHIGNAYTALINSVVARKNNGMFVVRIEDTDRTRLIEGSEQRILSSLAWLGISHQEGPDIGGPYAPYRQSDRLSLYRSFAEKLIANGHAYYCFCTPERLADMRKKQAEAHKLPMYDGECKKLDVEKAKERVQNGERHVVRLSVPESGETIFTDIIRGEIRFENALIDDQVILKSDGFPTYHLGVVIDDHLMGITHIIRGEEWISSTPKHVLLYSFFGWELPKFAHVSLLRNPDRSKLSKRKNPVWVSDYKKNGFLPEALRNFLANMAWSYPDGRDIFSTDEMVGEFELTQLQTTAPIFDIEKLRWMNGEYIRMKSDDELIDLIRDYYSHTAISFPAENEIATNKLRQIIPLVKERMKTLGEFWPLAGFFFEKPKEFEKPSNIDHVTAAKAALSTCAWDHDAMERAIRGEADRLGLKAREVFMQLRIAVTGKTVGPPLLESLEILGKEETLDRLTHT